MTETATTRAPLMMSVSGCRGIVGESLTPAVLTRYADAFEHSALSVIPWDAEEAAIAGLWAAAEATRLTGDGA